MFTVERGLMQMKNTIALNNKTLREVAYVLAKGVIRMKENGLLLTSGSAETKPVLQKPLKHVKQRVSG